MKKIAVIHTSLAIRDAVDREFQQAMPDCKIYNIIDEKMLQDVVDHGGVYPSIFRRMNMYIAAAEAMGVDAILNACSSVGEAFDMARKTTEIPTFRIDEPMAQLVVDTGKRIAVYGTVATTLKPSSALIRNLAAKQGKEVVVDSILIDGAFDVLSKEKNPEKHNSMVMERINATQQDYDVIVLAQASMTILVPLLQSLGKPVLYSLKTGIARVKEVLEA